MTRSNRGRAEAALNEAIRVLCAIPISEIDELESILSTTKWMVSRTNSVSTAMEVIRSTPRSVILCEEKLRDGSWLDLVEATIDFCPVPEIIVLSPHADIHLWAEVFNCGAYDLLARPLVPGEVYNVVPMAWRQLNSAPRTQARHIISRGAG